MSEDGCFLSFALTFFELSFISPIVGSKQDITEKIDFFDFWVKKSISGETIDFFLPCYRDNYFAAVSNTTDCSLESTAKSLLKLLCKPVKPVGRAFKARFLETQIAFDGNKTRCVLAFRTDPDRQGESKDVTSWPTCFDPRARMLIPGLVMGLVSKLRFYSASGVAGYTATVRKMYQFMKSLSYPKRWWLRLLAVALVRVGAPIVCLPALLRFAVS